MAFGNLVEGTPINAQMHFTGNFFDLLSPYTLIAGLAGFCVFVLHGAVFLSLKTDGVIRQRAEALTERCGYWSSSWRWCSPSPTMPTLTSTTRSVSTQGVMPVASAAALLAVGYFLRQKQFGWAFAFTGLTILLSVATFFWFLYPNVMVSSTDAAYNLTVDNAAASQKTLEIMTVVALIFVPIVLIYQGWSYWVFRKRVTAESHLEVLNVCQPHARSEEHAAGVLLAGYQVTLGAGHYAGNNRMFLSSSNEAMVKSGGHAGSGLPRNRQVLIPARRPATTSSVRSPMASTRSRGST
ncbi:MAG: hypothetical protein KatS3mg051_0099 [Anaerolineae bacterium]|nr:MAG: hypothetical protein KatS3mg051_0099 [Anaerolineae bacterium]